MLSIIFLWLVGFAVREMDKRTGITIVVTHVVHVNLVPCNIGLRNFLLRNVSSMWESDRGDVMSGNLIHLLSIACIIC